MDLSYNYDAHYRAQREVHAIRQWIADGHNIDQYQFNEVTGESKTYMEFDDLMRVLREAAANHA